MTLIACGFALAAVVLFVALSLDRQPPRSDTRTSRSSPVPTEPDVLGDDVLAFAEETLVREGVPEFRHGGWIQVSNERGELAQQYRFQRLDPTPADRGPGWMHMIEPELEVYGSDGQVVTLRGDSALAYAPSAAVESGTLTGRVLIQIYTASGDERADPSRDDPALALRTSSARFDGILGEVRCDDEILIEMRQGEFVGRKLRLLVDDQNEQIRVRVEEVDHVRLATARADATPTANVRSQPPPASIEPAEPAESAVASPPTPAEPEMPSAPEASTVLEPSSVPGAAPSEDPPQFYRLTLHDRVRIEQGRQRTAAGDSLSIIFTSESEGLGTRLAGLPAGDGARRRGPGSPERRPPAAAVALERSGFVREPGIVRARPHHPQAARLILASDTTRNIAPTRTIAPAPRPDDAIITCSGSLTIDPITDVREHLESPKDARLELVGAPVTLADMESETSAICGVLAYDLRQARLELLGSDEQDVLVESPRLMGRDETPQDAARPPAPATLSCHRLVIHLDPDAPTLTADHLHATGDVAVADRGQRLWADSLDVRLAPASSAAGEVEGDIESVIAESNVQLLMPDGQRVVADSIEIDPRRRTALVLGRDIRVIDGENLIDRGERIEIDERANRYVLASRGRYRRFNEPVVSAGDDPIDMALLDAAAGVSEELRVTWQEGVTVTLPDDGDEGGEPQHREASFSGGVQVTSRELKMTHADEMVVRLSPGEADRTAIESIDARGAVRARSVGQPGLIECGRLRLAMTTEDDGAVLPRRLTATDLVHVADDEQHLWTQRLGVTFRRSAAATHDSAAEDEPFGDTRVDVETAVAGGGVHLQLPGGEHVLAERLDADAARDTAHLTGPRVMVIADDLVLDNVRDILVDRSRGEYEARGPGDIAVYAAAVEMPISAGVIEPPELAGERTIEASWTGSARYRRQDTDDSGLVELQGDVNARSWTSEVELNAVDADTLVLAFEERFQASEGTSRPELVWLSASGGARLENRRWSDPERDTVPRVFYVAGDRVEYDLRTLEAHVTGAGELLLREDPAEASAVASTTLFRWEDALHMINEFEDLFRVEMSGNANCLRRDAEGGTMTATGQRFEATIARRADDGEAPAEAESGLTFSGSMEPLRIYGEGGISIRTALRDVACDEFDYNPGTGIAQLRATPGRMISVLTEGTPHPFQAESAMWNMNPGVDTIIVTRGNVRGGP